MSFKNSKDPCSELLEQLSSTRLGRLSKINSLLSINFLISISTKLGQLVIVTLVILGMSSTSFAFFENSPLKERILIPVSFISGWLFISLKLG